jgi:hypothetical protein
MDNTGSGLPIRGSIIAIGQNWINPIEVFSYVESMKDIPIEYRTNF